MVLIEMYPPENAVPGSSAEIKFSVNPANVEIIDSQLNIYGPSADLLPVSNDIYNTDHVHRKIVFPNGRVEDTGYYQFRCNGDCYADFELKVTPLKGNIIAIVLNIAIIRLSCGP